MLLGLAGCGPRFAPPATDAAGLEAARGLIAAAPPAAPLAQTPAEAEAVLARVAARLVPAAQPLCQGHPGEACAVQVVLDPEARTARAAMGGAGQVEITLGMLRLLGSEDELAAVLGHELGHHLAGHVGRRWTRGLAGGTAASTLLGAVVPFGGLAGLALGQGAAFAGSRAAQLAFSKDEEREADYLGAYFVARAGYDLDRAALLWARLTRAGAGTTAGLLDSHPAGPERLAAWREAEAEIRASADLMPHRPGGAAAR